MPELTRLESTKSMMRYLPPNGTAGLARSRVRGWSLVPCPPAITNASVLICVTASVSVCDRAEGEACHAWDRFYLAKARTSSPPSKKQSLLLFSVAHFLVSSVPQKTQFTVFRSSLLITYCTSRGKDSLILGHFWRWPRFERREARRLRETFSRVQRLSWLEWPEDKAAKTSATMK